MRRMNALTAHWPLHEITRLRQQMEIDLVVSDGLSITGYGFNDLLEVVRLAEAQTARIAELEKAIADLEPNALLEKCYGFMRQRPPQGDMEEARHERPASED